MNCINPSNMIFKIGLFVAISFLVSSCTNNTATVRYKVIASLEISGVVKEFSNVMEVEYTKNSKPTALGYGGSSKTRGEALVIEVGDKDRLFLLPSYFHRLNRSFTGLYTYSIMLTANTEGGLGSLSNDDLSKLNGLSGRHKLVTRKGQYGVDFTFVAFSDEENPNSIYELDIRDFGNYFGKNVKLVSIDIEVVDAPITTGKLVNHLPWLADYTLSTFNRAPLLNPPPRSDWPIGWVISYENFINK